MSDRWLTVVPWAAPRYSTSVRRPKGNPPTPFVRSAASLLRRGSHARYSTPPCVTSRSPYTATPGSRFTVYTRSPSVYTCGMSDWRIGTGRGTRGPLCPFPRLDRDSVQVDLRRGWPLSDHSLPDLLTPVTNLGLPGDGHDDDRRPGQDPARGPAARGGNPQD